MRGVRFALEVPDIREIIMGDLNPNAVRLSEENVRRNGVQEKVRVSLSDANVLLTSLSAPGLRLDYVDLDPFGSPAPFMDSAVRATRSRGLLALTATDMAPLCGVHVRSCLRKYGAIPMRVGYSKEIAIRILLGALARVASAHDMGIRPLLCHATDHYARAYCYIERGPGKANESSSKLGYIAHCPSCHEREVIHGLAGHLEGRCPSCGSRRLISGPLWTGNLFNKGFCRAVLGELGGAPWVSPRAGRLLARLVEEAEGPPTYYAIHRLCDDLGIAMPSTGSLIRALREQGFWASRTHFDPQGVRTDAPAGELIRILRGLVG